MAKPIEQAKCRTCKRPSLMQWLTNPVIADCPLHGRKVADSGRRCADYIKCCTDKKILKFSDYGEK